MPISPLFLGYTNNSPLLYLLTNLLAASPYLVPNSASILAILCCVSGFSRYSTKFCMFLLMSKSPFIEVPVSMNWLFSNGLAPFLNTLPFFKSSLRLKITWLLEYPLSYTLLKITPSALILSAARSNAALLGTSPTVTIGLSNSKSPSTL